VIGESSKNAKGECFKYQGYDHIVAQYPSRSLLVKGTNSNDEGLETIIYELVGSESDTMRMLELLEINASVGLMYSTPILHIRGRIIS